MPAGQQSPEAVLAIHARHPELRSVYVEGTLDHIVVDGLLKESGINNVRVFSADFLDISHPELVRRGLLPGNKGKLVHLSRLISPQEIGTRISCIVDQDAGIDGMELTGDSIIPTDFSCMEMLAFNTKSMDRLLRSLRITQLVGQDVLSDITEPLVQLSLMRIHSHKHALGCSPQPLDKFVHASDRGRLTVDIEGYRLAYANSAPNATDAKASLANYHDELPKALKDPTQLINGHDFFGVLKNVARICGANPSFRNDQVLGTLLANSIDLADVRTGTMATRLLSMHK